MISVRKKILSMSRSRTLIIPKIVLNHLDVTYGDWVEIAVEGDHLTIRAAKEPTISEK